LFFYKTYWQQHPSRSSNNLTFLFFSSVSRPLRDSFAFTLPARTEDSLNLGAPTSTSPAALSSEHVDTSLQHANAASTSANASSTTIPEQLAHIFSCSNSVNPHMRSKAARLQTFRDRSDEWPAHRIAATPEQMVQAGFFYLGKLCENVWI